MNRTEKQQVVSNFSKRLEGFQAAVLTSYRGLNVEQMNMLRRRLREEKISYLVVKNTLMKLAAKGTDLEKLAPYFEGPTAIAISHGDPVPLSKILTEFTKTQPNLEIKIGLIQGKIASPEEIKSLSILPTRDVLFAQVLNGIQSPAQQLAGIIINTIQKIAIAIQSRVDQLAKQPVTES